ncbi:MAG: arginine repressor [Bacteroidetes bacterium]|jgi:transcriptional regulator of arginine metabolism|nr:arginine repressor [Bacteroidota bacterium]
MNKNERHLALKEVITARHIGTQDELVRALKQAGFPVTQATLSRDMKELRIARVNGPEGPRYALTPEAEEKRLQPYLAFEIESISFNESLIVVKTLPGRAQGVAEILDSFHHPDILGTLAGDNTVFVTPRSTKKIPKLVKELRGMAVEVRMK